AQAEAGEYIVSVNCTSAEGKKYIFKNVLSATVISGMPQLTVTPASLSLKFEDLDPLCDSALPTAQVVTTGDAAKVTGYELRNLRKGGEPVDGIDAFFSVNQETGEVSAVKGNGWTVGRYVMDIKVNTESFGTESTEGLVADALTVNVSADPVVVNYLETPTFAPNITRTYTPTLTGPVPSDYAISKVTFSGAEYAGAEFSIDPATGVVTAAGKEDTGVGEYKVSISYKYAGQDLYSDDVLTVRFLPGVPEGILVTPAAASVEDKDIAEGSSASLPVFTLAANGESAAVTGYQVKAVRKDGVDFAFSGLVTVEGNTVRIQHGNWPLGDYTFDIKVNTESFGSTSDKGVFKDLFSLTVFEKPTLTYDAATMKEYAPWSISPVKPMPAGYSYAFTDPAASYTGFISLDPSTGVLSALKGNKLPKGTHEIRVTASAAGQESSTATVALEVVENPYHFTYFSYGNNLGLTEEQTDGASQYRAKSESEFTSATYEVKYTDLKPGSGVEFKIKTQSQTKATISKSDGTLSFEEMAAPVQQMGVVLVTAT
ncbi:MAG: surface glycan-binding family protein, partial [Candidatus Cryptobacteroides sp.]